MTTRPVSENWLTSCFRGLGVTLEQLRVDRQLDEALTAGPTPSTSPPCSASATKPPSGTPPPHAISSPAPPRTSPRVDREPRDRGPPIRRMHPRVPADGPSVRLNSGESAGPLPHPACGSQPHPGAPRVFPAGQLPVMRAAAGAWFYWGRDIAAAIAVAGHRDAGRAGEYDPVPGEPPPLVAEAIAELLHPENGACPRTCGGGSSASAAAMHGCRRR